MSARPGGPGTWPPAGVGERARFLLDARIAALDAASRMVSATVQERARLVAAGMPHPPPMNVRETANVLERWLLRDPTEAIDSTDGTGADG